MMTEERFNEIKLMVEKEYFFMRPQDADAIQELINELEPILRRRKIVVNNSNKLKLVDLFRQMEVFPTNAEMRRLLHQGAIKLNDEICKLDTDTLNNVENIYINNGIHTMQVGKRTLYYFQIVDGKLENWNKYINSNKE